MSDLQKVLNIVNKMDRDRLILFITTFLKGLSENDIKTISKGLI